MCKQKKGVFDMKKLFASVIALLFAFNFAIAEGNEAAADEKKILVVYFSATGSTEQAAQTIAEVVGGDLFALAPVESYTDEDLDWTADGSRVNREHDDESLRAVELVSTAVENWDEYDTVFIGYPIWWGIAAWPVNGFVTANDFSGKTVIPFCTSAGSGLGQSAALLEALTETGTWLEGHRFGSYADADEVTEWLSGLAY